MKADQEGEPNAPEHEWTSGRMEGTVRPFTKAGSTMGTKYFGKERSMLVG